MALNPWRFQADITPGEADPMVTLFVGAERAKMDNQGEPTGETVIEQNIADPIVLKLSELPAILAGGAVTRKPMA
jgi:hypothetical protein